MLYSSPKLYANQSDRGTSVSISYRSGRSEQVSGSLGQAGAFLLWLGLAALARRRRTQGAFAIALGAAALLTTRFYFGGDSSGAIQLFVFLSAAALAWLAWKRIGGVVRDRIDAFMADDPEPPPEDATATPTDDDEDEAFDGAIDEAPKGASTTNRTTGSSNGARWAPKNARSRRNLLRLVLRFAGRLGDVLQREARVLHEPREALLTDGAESSRGDPKANPAVLILEPYSLRLNIRQLHFLGTNVRVRNFHADVAALASQVAAACHDRVLSLDTGWLLAR